MKLDHREGFIHRGGSSDGGGMVGMSGHHHAQPNYVPAEQNAPSERAQGTSVGEIMASRLSHLDRMANWREAWNPRLSMSLASTKGLMNAPGDNNCFLNSAVQVLWHLDVFRRSFRLLSGHACMGNSCIFCSLKVLFTQLQYSDRSTLPPDALRRALASSFQDQLRFQLGHMDDAAECFENILTRIHYHIAHEISEDSCKEPHCIPHQKFAMDIVEQILCPCGATTEPLPFTQMVHYVSANALVIQAKMVPLEEKTPVPVGLSAEVFAQLLKNATSEGDVRNCPSNCGEKVTIRRSLMNIPDVVSIGLIWDSDRPSLEHIKDVVQSIGTTLRLPDLFHSVSELHRQWSGTLHLVGVVCYYGKHYSTFFFHSKMKKWVYFDDANVKEMGPDWQNVADKCCRGHYQPLLLLYANPDCEPVETHTAPDVTTQLPGYQHFNGGSNKGATGHSSLYLTKGKSDPPPHQFYDHTDRTGRRAITPGPENRNYQQTSVPRRAVTPGPDYERSFSGNDETDGSIGVQAGAAHFRQSSYLIAVDCTSNVPSTGEKVHRSKTATHGGDPYSSTQRNCKLVQNGPHYSRPSNLSGPTIDNHPAGSIQIHHGQQSHNAASGKQFQYIPPQTHPLPVGQKSESIQGCARDQTPNTPPSQSQQQQQPVQYQNQLPQSADYQAWTLSTSEPYRRKNMPKSPELRPVVAKCPESQPNLGFVCPTSPSKNKTSTSLAKVNEIQRLESFKKGKGKVGADVVRYQVSPTEQTTPVNPYGPLDPEALYPGHESGVMQSPKQSEAQGRHLPTSQSQPLLRSEIRPVCQHQMDQHQPIQNNLKRTHSLENTIQPGPGESHSQRVIHQSGAATTGRSRPHSARQYETGTSPRNAPPTTPKLGPKHASNAPQNIKKPLDYVSGVEQLSKVVEGKPPRRSSHVPSSLQDEDPYGTLQYINRKAVESVLTYQQQKPGGHSARMHNASQVGPGSVGSRSSNSSLETASEQLVQTSAILPPYPALPEALQVEIPSDNISLSSHKDSGYRSGSSGGSGRNSATLIGVVSVDSPGSSQLANQKREPAIHHSQRAAPKSEHKQTLGYANPEAKSHSSTDSLSSGQSAQSYATVRAAAHCHQQSSSLQQKHSQMQQPQPIQHHQHPPYQQQHQRQHTQSHQKYRSPNTHILQSQQLNKHQQQNLRPPSYIKPDSEKVVVDLNLGPGELHCGAADPHPVIVKAETLMDELNQREKDGDLPTAIAVCAQAISCLQQAINSQATNSDMRSYLQMKYNMCLLRSRSMHVRLTASHESVNAAGLSTEDYGSVSSQCPDVNVRELKDLSQHRSHSYQHQSNRHHQTRVPSSAIYEQQYSTDSGYSSHSFEVNHHQHHPTMPHSYTDGALSSHRQSQELHTNRQLRNKIAMTQGEQEPSYKDNESDKKSIEIYGTLPRKHTPKTKAMSAIPSRDDKDKGTEVYQVCLQKQRETAHKRQWREGSAFQQILSHQRNANPPQQLPPQHGRQASNSKKINKEQIKQLLINEFMVRKEGKKDGQALQAQTQQLEGNQEHQRLHHILASELSHQVKGVAIKDVKRAQSEMNLHQVDQGDHINYFNHGRYEGDFASPTDHTSRSAMVHPDSILGQVSANIHHSRESSCSSTTTLKAHSRENSLSSPPLSPKPRYHKENSQHSTDPAILHPAWHRVTQPVQSVCIDRDTNPPKPSMIGKLDKMHQQQPLEQQQWIQQQGLGWQAAGAAVKKSNIRKAVSHTQLPVSNGGQADWTARSEGAVVPTKTLPKTKQEEMTNTVSTNKVDEEFPPPPPDMLVFENDPIFPPPLELLDQQPEPSAQEQPARPVNTKPYPPPKLSQIGGSALLKGAKQQQDEETLVNVTSLTATSNGNLVVQTSNVSALVASIEGNTVAIHKKPPHVKMKPRKVNCTFSTFFPTADGSEDRSSLSSVESNSFNSCHSHLQEFESDSSSYQTSTGSNFSNTDCEPSGDQCQKPERPKSAMKKKREGRQRRKSVSFSDNVALVADQEEVDQSQGIDYMQYVSKVLEQSKRQKNQGLSLGQNHDRTSMMKSNVAAAAAKKYDGEMACDSNHALANGYDSDFDEDTASSASTTDGEDISQIRCNLCSKKVVEGDEMYCANCMYYMSRFQPAPKTPAS